MKTVGFALCGSFCTLSRVFVVVERMVKDDWDVVPILSFCASEMDTRFGKAADFCDQLEEICGHKPLRTLQEVEPIGPKQLLDVLVVAPCTGSTLARIAHGLSDTPVSLAVKSQLRVERPVVIAVSSNDALAGSAKNIAELLCRRNVYFTPMRQDAPMTKPRSMVAVMEDIPKTVQAALEGKQVQPILI